jgi:hypothetical protein
VDMLRRTADCVRGLIIANMSRSDFKSVMGKSQSRGDTFDDWEIAGLDEKEPAPKLLGSGAGVFSEALLRLMR